MGVKPGASLTLSIDERIQFACERELKRAVESNNCGSGSVVVMDPRTGEILALASVPTYDPNDPGDALTRGFGPSVQVLLDGSIMGCPRGSFRRG